MSVYLTVNLTAAVDIIFSGYTHNCSDIVIPACQGIPGYTKTVVSEEMQRKYSGWMARRINYRPNDTCSELRKEIMCAENVPACIDNTAGFLCRENCYKFFNKCATPFFYSIDMCMEFPKRVNTSKELVICKQTHWPRAENWKLEAGSTVTSKAGRDSSIFVNLILISFTFDNLTKIVDFRV